MSFTTLQDMSDVDTIKKLHAESPAYFISETLDGLFASSLVSSAFKRQAKMMEEGQRCSSCHDSKDASQTGSEEGASSHCMCMMPSLRPMFCNVCGDALQRVNLSKVTIYALACEVCKLRTHKKCVSKASPTCKWTTLASMGRAVAEGDDGSLLMPHQWMVGNFAVNSRCFVCERSCGSILRLQDSYCLWCQATVHTGCREATSICDLGPARISILPPTHITAFDEGGTWRATKPPKSSPLLVFVNTKSGDNQGVKMLRKFKQLLNPAQVFDLMSGGTFKGLKLFQNFESFRVLVCGGDGSVAWVLNEIDHLDLHKQCQVGILPLGTGNDLSRVMGWGASFDDDTLLPSVIEKLETAQIQMFDRWSIMSYEVDRLQNRIIPLDPIGAYEDSAANHLSRIIYSDSYNVVITSAMVLCGIVQELVSKVVSLVEELNKGEVEKENEAGGLEGQDARCEAAEGVEKTKTSECKMHSEDGDSLVSRCVVLRDKMEALLLTLAEESAASQGCSAETMLASLDVVLAAGRGDGVEGKVVGGEGEDFEVVGSGQEACKEADLSGVAEGVEPSSDNQQTLDANNPPTTSSEPQSSFHKPFEKGKKKEKNIKTLRSKDQLMNRANSLRKAIRNIVELTEKAIDDQNHQTCSFDAENSMKTEKELQTDAPHTTATTTPPVTSISKTNFVATPPLTQVSECPDNTLDAFRLHCKPSSHQASTSPSTPHATTTETSNVKKNNGLTIDLASSSNRLNPDGTADPARSSPKPLTPIPFNYQLCELEPLSHSFTYHPPLPKTTSPHSTAPTTATVIPTTSATEASLDVPSPIVPANIFVFPVTPERNISKDLSECKLNEKTFALRLSGQEDDEHCVQNFNFEQTASDFSDADDNSICSTPGRLSPAFQSPLPLRPHAQHLSPPSPPAHLDMNLVGRWSPIFGMPSFHQATSPRYASASPSFPLREPSEASDKILSPIAQTTSSTATSANKACNLTTTFSFSSATASTTPATKKHRGRHVSSLSRLQQDSRIGDSSFSGPSGCSQSTLPKIQQHVNFPLLNIPLLQALPSQSINKRRKSSPVHSSLISKVLLANADALCAPISPFNDLENISSEDFSEKCVMNNYFGIGLDAKIALDFHNKREEHPNKCRSRTKNMMWYGVLGGKEVLQRTHKNLDQKVRLECDGKLIPLPNLQGIVVLNIPSYMGGINFWGGFKEDGYFLAPSSDDKILEVVAVFGSIQLGISRVINLQKHRIAQCRSVRITIIGDEGIPVQVDGEAWIQNPGVIWIRHKNRAQLLTRDRAFEEALKNWKRTESEKKERLNLASVREWTSADVDKWLASIDLETYAENFRKHEVHGAELINLQRNDLKDLGISKVGHVKRLLREIKILKGLSKHCIGLSNHHRSLKHLFLHPSPSPLPPPLQPVVVHPPPKSNPPSSSSIHASSQSKLQDNNQYTAHSGDQNAIFEPSFQRASHYSFQERVGDAQLNTRRDELSLIMVDSKGETPPTATNLIQSSFNSQPSLTTTVTLPSLSPLTTTVTASPTPFSPPVSTTHEAVMQRPPYRLLPATSHPHESPN